MNKLRAGGGGAGEGGRERSDRLVVINVKAVMHVSEETNERMGRGFS